MKFCRQGVRRSSGAFRSSGKARICDWEGSRDRISYIWDCGKRHSEATRQDGCEPSRPAIEIQCLSSQIQSLEKLPVLEWKDFRCPRPVCKPEEVVRMHMPAKLQPMGYRRTIQEEYASQKPEGRVSPTFKCLPSSKPRRLVLVNAPEAKQPLFASI